MTTAACPNWWDTHVPHRREQWEDAIGGPQKRTRVMLRHLVVDSGYKSVADVGCGLAVDAAPFRRLGIDYAGIDSSAYLIAQAPAGANVRLGSLESTGLPDASVDLAYVRHAIEYAEAPEPVMLELIRLARQCAVIILGQSPARHDQRDAGQRKPLWNCWGIARYEAFLAQNMRVLEWNWRLLIGNEGIGGLAEAMLIIDLKPLK